MTNIAPLGTGLVSRSGSGLATSAEGPTFDDEITICEWKRMHSVFFLSFLFHKPFIVRLSDFVFAEIALGRYRKPLMHNYIVIIMAAGVK